MFGGFLLGAYGQHFRYKLINPINYSELKVTSFTLPDILLCNNGTMVTNVKQWEKTRRPEILSLFSTYMFGKVPNIKGIPRWKVLNTNYKALGGRAIRRQVRLWPKSDYSDYFIDVQLYLPITAINSPVSLFLGIALLPNYTVYNDPENEKPDSILIADGIRVPAYKNGAKSDFWQLDMILKRGYGLATFCHQDLSPDTKNDFETGFPSLFYRQGQNYPDPDEWGAISMWAWQMSRVLDYLVTDELVDRKRIIAIGHSRLGKTALWAAAQDRRFAMVIPNNSGLGGTAISRRYYGETIEAINQRYPQWFCGNFKQFSNREQYLPFDQHELIALIAPRPVYIASAEDDKWADPKGEFLGGKEASVIYHLYGLKGLECDSMPEVGKPITDGFIGYHIRKGKHTMTAYDWTQFLNFADLHLRKQNIINK